MVDRLPEPALRHLHREAGAIYGAKRDFNPRQLAMRFFGFYCTEYDPFDPNALEGEGVIISAIPTMRAWAKADRTLALAADSEIKLLVKFLYEGFELSGTSKEDLTIAQMQLLALATGREDHLLEDVAKTARGIAAGLA